MILVHAAIFKNTSNLDFFQCKHAISSRHCCIVIVCKWDTVCIHLRTDQHSFSLHSKPNRFLILRPGQKIATSPLQGLGQYVQHEALLFSILALSLTHTNTLPSMFLFLLLSQPSAHHQPRASCLHHSAQTPQQPYAIREEPTAAILINIDSVSTYPSGSVRNSRYCINTPTANTTHSQ